MEAKIEILITYWDKLVNRLMLQSGFKNDPHMKELISKFILINDNVRKACLRKFISQANLLYAVAFFQWRYKYPNDVKWMKEELEELIEQR